MEKETNEKPTGGKTKFMDNDDMEKQKLPTVCVTGGTGFLGSTICQFLLSEGTWDVRCTVRNKLNDKKMQPLKDGLGRLFDDLDVYNAEMEDPDAIDAAIEGCQYVIHCASPFPQANPTTADALIKPAVEGTLAVMRACQKWGVRRVVITSSIFAAAEGYLNGERPNPVTENDWSQLEGLLDVKGSFARSKTLAEKAAWDF